MNEDDDLPELEPLSKKDYIAQECEHLLLLKVWPGEIATSLGYKNADSLNAALVRWGLKDLAEKFERWRYDGNVPAAIVYQVQQRKLTKQRKREEQAA